MRHLAGLLAIVSAAHAAPPPPPTSPNVVVILADDLDFDYKQDRLAIMPHLRALRESGAHFVNHVAAFPVCGPSRSSFLAGRLPHNTKYQFNGEPRSMAAWAKEQDNTVGTWLTARGYHTSFFGKYVNGMEQDVPLGWRHWGGFSSGVATYNYYNATGYNVSFAPDGVTPTGDPTAQVNMHGVHQSDFLAKWALAQIDVARSEGRPFYAQLNPVMVHWGVCTTHTWSKVDPHWEWNVSCPMGEPLCCPEQAKKGAAGCALPIDPCPSVATAHMFDGLTNPHTPSWNASASGVLPSWVRDWPGVSAFEEERQNMGYRNRTSSAVDLDDMIGELVAGLEIRGVLNNTFVIMTSDNGYHLGEHAFIFGKGTPYDTDVRLPFYVRGPTIPANTTLLHPTTHVDLTATIVELTGAVPVGPPLDGKSFASALTPSPGKPGQWRAFSYSEFAGNNDTWVSVRQVSWWCSGQGEVFDLVSDPWELRNTAGATPNGDALLKTTLPTLVALSRCSGAMCSSEHGDPVPAEPLPCYRVQPGLSAQEMDPFDY